MDQDNTVKLLIKLANSLDEQGDEEAARRIDHLIYCYASRESIEITEESGVPDCSTLYEQLIRDITRS